MGKPLTTNEKAAILAIIGGVLMLIAGASGAATWAEIGRLVERLIGNDSLNLVFQVLVIIGALGGLVVILGGVLLRKKDTVKGGKMLITIGAGFGLIGLMIFIVLAIVGDEPGATILGALGIGFAGLVLSIAARMRAQA